MLKIAFILQFFFDFSLVLILEFGPFEPFCWKSCWKSRWKFPCLSPSQGESYNKVEGCVWCTDSTPPSHTTKGGDCELFHIWHTHQARPFQPFCWKSCWKSTILTILLKILLKNGEPIIAFHNESLSLYRVSWSWSFLGGLVVGFSVWFSAGFQQVFSTIFCLICRFSTFGCWKLCWIKFRMLPR